MTVAPPTAVRSTSALTVATRLLVAALIVVAVTGTFIDTAIAGPVNPFNFFGYFTIQSNLLYAATLVIVTVIAQGRDRLTDLLLLARCAMTTYLVIVGSVYASLLAPLGVGSIAPPWANVVLHMITPVFAMVDWLMAADRRRIPFGRLWLLLLYPFVWIVVVLIRGATDGWVPYPFLDPVAGYAVLAMYVVAILIAMLTVGSLVILASRAPILTSQRLTSRPLTSRPRRR